MNKRNLLFVMSFLISLLSVKAQDELLVEDFELGALPTGWTTIQEPTAGGHWRVSDYAPLTGTYNLYIDEKKSSAVGDYDPIKEEYVITPAISLPGDKDYGVKFLWQAQSIGVLEKSSYNFRVSVSEDNGSTWTQVWAASDKESLEKSGVVYPWKNWSKNTSTVSLKDYKGKTVKIAFIYNLMIPDLGNMVKLDDISIIPYTAIENPIAGGSTSYRFENAYIGVKEKSAQPLFITNQGIGQLKVLSIEGLSGTDFSTDLKPENVSLTMQQTYFFNVYFTPTITGAASATMTIKTNGGDVVIALSGTKKGLPTGYTLESFEGTEFPPTGWTNTEWVRSTASRSGDYAVSASFSNLATLTSPRLTLPGGNHDITFDYAVVLGEEVTESPENDFYVEFSRNGGATWTKIWTCTDYSDLPYTRLTVKTGLIGASDNCYIRFVYKIDGALSYETICSSIYVDNVVLPPLYGSNLKPVPVTNPVPASGSVDQFVNNLKLSWRSTLHVDGYKLFVGKDQNNPTSVVNGETLSKDAISYVLNGLEYNTTYYWKVVPFNAQGDADGVQTWSFTTMEDMSISTFPYFNGFEDGTFPPVGWLTEQVGSRGWSTSDIRPYDGKYSITVFAHQNGGYAILQSPEIVVPSDKDLQISFVWGNSSPVNLTKSANDNEVLNGDSVYFEVSKAGSDWKTLAICSQESGERKWVKQKVLLSDYKGERITVRWRYNCYNAVKSSAGALDNIEISLVSNVGVPVISYTEWVAGVVERKTSWNASILNYKQSKYSGEIFTLANEGEYDLEVKSAKFDTDFFTATGVNANTVIQANKEIKFGINFNAVREQAVIEDTLRIEFVDGQIVKFPVEGSAMGQYTYCYTFDDLTAFTTQIADFKTVDQDGFATVNFSGLFFPGKGSAMAYKVINWKEADWRNVYPRSGNQVLAAFGADETSTSPTKEVIDWLITKKVTPMDNAKLRFYAKSYAADDIWTASKLTVLVSTTTDSPASFTEVPAFTNVEIPAYADDREFMECTIDLSQYKDQDIYVAIRHNVKGGLALFIDDLYLENFKFTAPGNRAPDFLTTPPAASIEVGQTYTYDFTVTDPDNDALTIVVKGLPSWLTYTPRANGGILTGVPTQSGDFYIRIEANDGEFTTPQEVDIKVLPGSSISNTDADNAIKVYPNPVTSVLYIDAEQVGKVSLTDIAGKEVFAGENTTEINVANLPSGIYLLKVYSDNNIYTTKVIKK
ncbi:MAG: choice-of-anchor J domain-containing protein [Dysgonomonas sp.]